MAERNSGRCEHCRRKFDYAIYHSGFGDCAYAYCDRCGRTAVLDGWNERIPTNIGFKVHAPIARSVEPHLLPCACGGAFRGDASPRCPHCREALSAVAATAYIEADAPGTKKGWKWQQSWDGIYCIDIERQSVRDNWRGEVAV